MEALFHFIFELIKISILGSIYACLVLFIFMIIARYNPDSWFYRRCRKKLLVWFVSGLIISITLFVYMFSYWGDHGLGDGPKIPIGHGIVVDNTNWNKYGYLNDISTSGKQEIEMTKFIFTNKELIGNLDSGFYRYENEFFVLNLESKEIKEFASINSFNEYAKDNNLPTYDSLLTFKDNYTNRWGGWRFWLLP